MAQALEVNKGRGAQGTGAEDQSGLASVSQDALQWS